MTHNKRWSNVHIHSDQEQPRGNNVMVEFLIFLFSIFKACTVNGMPFQSLQSAKVLLE